ncbi:MAG: hypothetical protein L0H41_14190 [Microlunatus sp.]|nr:hypothetical protein [Microlunatus sp.]MDN5769382.1 hypothetical protein [Microlunatus sp.]
MEEWQDPIQKAAVWYVAAFGALSAVLIAGVSLTSFDASRARHPLLAILAAILAVAAVAWVGFAASRVLSPRWTTKALLGRYTESAKRGSWADIASGDPRVLSPLYVEDGFSGDNDSPRSLWAQAQAADADAAGRLREMVAAANRRTSRRWFSVVTVTAPIALAVVLFAALAWGTLSRPDAVVATTDNPLPVRVRLNEGVDPATVFGAGCTDRERTGVAIEGTIPQQALVALPATGSCPAALVSFDPTIGSIVRA